MSNRYVLDANVFIEPKNKYYAFDICPGFWTSLITLNRSQRVVSIDQIRKELLERDDEISDWIKNKAPDSFFKKTEDKAVEDAYKDIMAWVYSQSQFSDAAKAEFASGADGWVVGYAKVNGLSVVTQELYAPEAKRKVLIPNICLEFDVDFVNVFDMLRQLKVRFVRSTKRGRRVH